MKSLSLKSVFLIFLIFSCLHPSSAQHNGPRSRFPKYVPTSHEIVQDMLWMAQVGEEDILYDLGSGDGRVLIAAVRDFGAARAVGIEIDPDLAAESRANVEAAGLDDLIKIIEGDLFAQDFSEATVVTLYLGHEYNLRLRPKLFASLKPGSRVVSHKFTMGEWRHDKMMEIRGEHVGMIGFAMGSFSGNRGVPDYSNDQGDPLKDRVFLWYIPEPVSGVWTSEIQIGDETKLLQVNLRQKLSEPGGEFILKGTDMAEGRVDATLNNGKFRMALNNRTPKYKSYGIFEGSITGDTIAGKMLRGFDPDTKERITTEWNAVRATGDFTGVWEWPSPRHNKPVQLIITEASENTYSVFYRDGDKEYEVADFYDFGGGFYLTIPFGRSNYGAFEMNSTSGWVLISAVAIDGSLSGKIDFHRADGGYIYPPAEEIKYMDYFSKKKRGSKTTSTQTVERVPAVQTFDWNPVKITPK